MSTKRRFSVATIFPLIVLGYVLIQVYAAWNAYVGLRLPSWTIPLLAFWVVFMTFSLPLVWRLERVGWHRVTTVISWIGFGWMGWVFLYFWIALVLAILAFIVKTFSIDFAVFLRSFPLAGGLALLASLYGFLDARRVRVENVKLVSPKLGSQGNVFRVALITDVHLGTLVGARRLKRILDRLRQLDADVVLSAGDLVDGLEHRLRELAPLFDEIRPRFGKFAVTGNHEYYAGIAHALNFHKRAGFTVLRGAAVNLTDKIALAGVDDPTGRSSHADEYGPLTALPRDRFTILLKHQPVLNPKANGLFDLQLSGHVHRGQIFPFGLLVKLAYPVATGLTRLAHGAWLYVSRGTGTWGPPMRVGASPEITLIEIHAGTMAS